jgi:two-component sensor histidine kinase
MRDEGGTLRRVVGAILDVTERKRFEEHLRLLIDELNHRVKNTLATVQSIAAQTLRSSGSDAEARDAFEARLIALSSAHNVLTRRNWEGATLPDIVQVALAPHRVGRADRIETCGPDLWVEPRAALALAMALHELATNAAKYGALSNREGTVEVTWRVEPDREGREGEGSRRAHLAWTERGGPRVEPPTRRGFGTRLIERSLSGDLEGRAEIAYAPEGFRCTVSWPLPRR